MSPCSQVPPLYTPALPIADLYWSLQPWGLRCLKLACMDRTGPQGEPGLINSELGPCIHTPQLTASASPSSHRQDHPVVLQGVGVGWTVLGATSCPRTLPEPVFWAYSW